MPEIDQLSIIVIVLGLFFGGFVKGAAGAGMPIVAVPVIAAFYDVRIAVILLVIPNFFSNIWQVHKYKHANIYPDITIKLAASGFVGAGLGTILLASLPIPLLSLLISLIIFLYIGLRLLTPNFSFPIDIARRWIIPAGFCGGILQGAIGLSSPIVFTYLHAMGLPRKTFIITISVFFVCLSTIQVPMQVWLGLMNWTLATASMLALLPIMLGLYIGERLGEKFSQKAFDRSILALLIVLGLKMLFDGLSKMFN